MKKKLSVIGVVLLTIGMLMATGVDQEPVQAIYALILTAAGAWAFNRAERIGKNEQSGRTMPIERSTEEDAAA